MRVVCKVERVVIVRFELDLVLGLDVIRLARHDGGRSVAEYVLMRGEVQDLNKEKGGGVDGQRVM